MREVDLNHKVSVAKYIVYIDGRGLIQAGFAKVMVEYLISSYSERIYIRSRMTPFNRSRDSYSC
jgi:hypothetical protein